MHITAAYAFNTNTPIQRFPSILASGGRYTGRLAGLTGLVQPVHDVCPEVDGVAQLAAARASFRLVLSSAGGLAAASIQIARLGFFQRLATRRHSGFTRKDLRILGGATDRCGQSGLLGVAGDDLVTGTRAPRGSRSPRGSARLDTSSSAESTRDESRSLLLGEHVWNQRTGCTGGKSK